MLDGIGPFVAIGDPKEKLPDLGAARLYVSDEWREVVIELLARVSLVVMRVATTEAVRWELQQVVSRLARNGSCWSCPRAAGAIGPSRQCVTGT